MFENLRNAFSSAAKSLGEKELKEKDVDEVLEQLEISLLESDVATEVINSIKSDLKKKLIGTKVEKNEIVASVKNSLIQTISSMFDNAGKVDLLNAISEKKKLAEPFVIVFVGINGTGKTTTVAKIANLLKQSKFSVVVAAADTYRAGAIEQIKEHTNRLNLKLVAQNYGSDPASVARDAVLYAKSHKIDCVLVDTAGRMQTSKNLMEQISKITKVIKPDMKIFVGDSLAGNDTVNQAREFYEQVEFNGAVLTKVDADARGGAALSIVSVTSKPILYVGMGQEYADLEPFDKFSFLKTVFGDIDTTESTEEIHEKPISETPLENPTVTTQSKQVVNQVESDSQPSETDPFAGIADKDIKNFVELYNIPSPEDDKEAIQLASKIKKWISDERPTPEEEQVQTSKTSKDELVENKDNNESQKSKKKGSFLGRFKK